MSGFQIPHFGLQRQYKALRTELLDATDDVLKSGHLINGHFTRSLEEWLRYRTRAKYAITVHSGTQALEIIARYKHSVHSKSMDGNPTIQLPNLTYPATLNAFISAGWNIELVDTDKYGILASDIVAGKYICLVGLYGRKPWNHASINNSYSFIIDGAQHWLIADGEIGSGMAISFDPTKNLPANGNGGAIVTNDKQLYEYADAYRNNGKTSQGFTTIGSNSKMSEQDCAQLFVKTKYIDTWQHRRKDIAEYWCKAFKNLPLTCLSDDKVPHAHQKFVVYTNDRNSLHTHCILHGINTRVHYEYVLGDLPTAKDYPKPDLLSKSVMLSRGVLSLPIYPELTDSEVDYISDKITEFYS